ncbi:MAG TPA: MipA/OmpV family protein [Burkholderiaceae bacterium]|nr:MipA/OmpV family protein [Burkholderiaceae bacterium]
MTILAFSGGRALPFIAALLALPPPFASAQEVKRWNGEPIWEAGLAGGGGWISDYPGSDQAHLRGLVAPIVFYRGPVLRIDREGMRGRLFGREDLELDLAATASFNARDNRARSGMPDLDYLVGVGPQLIYHGLHYVPGAPALHLKLNATASTNLHRINGRGFSVESELRWRRGTVTDNAGEWTLSVGPTWASGPLMRHFYEVAPQYATTTRPAYAARSGYLGTDLKLTIRRRAEASWSWFMEARAMSLHGAANRSSPLFRSSTGFALGAGVIWTPWQSEGRTTSD